LSLQLQTNVYSQSEVMLCSGIHRLDFFAVITRTAKLMLTVQ